MTEALLSALQKRFPAYVESLPALLPALEAGEPPLFVLRYRRDLLGGLDDGTFRKIRAGFREERELLKRRGATLRALQEAESLDEEMKHRVEQTRDLALLEDLIRPIRESRRAGKKAEDPMSAVARQILAATPEEPGAPLEEQLTPFCGKEGAHPTVEDQTQRLRRLLADEIGTDALGRQAVRNVMRRKGKLVTIAVEGKEVKPQYAAAIGVSEPLNRVKPRTLLLIRRGQKAGALHAHVEIPAEDLQTLFEGLLSVPPEHPHADLVREATLDAMERVLLPAASIEVINERKRIADRSMVPTFAETLRERAMTAPAGPVAVVAVAPGATGAARILAVDADGKPGRTEAIHPLPPRNEDEEGARILREIVAESGARLVAVPASGRASGLREWVAKALDGARELGARPIAVHEAAAVALAGTEAGKAEAPELPASARTALSLAHYVQDPLAEIVRYDLTRLALGANQRDVDQGELRRALEETLDDCVALVGVDLNTASPELLMHVPGLGEAAVKAIVAQRESEGAFATLADLRALEAIDEDAWQRSTGFLRIEGGAEPFDVTAGHPTGLPIARAIVERVGKELSALLVDSGPIQVLEPEEFASEAHTAADVESVLRAIGRGRSDPRGVFLTPVSNPGVRRLRDIKEDMELEGVIASVAKFGAFVDVGAHQQGLVHVSELCHGFLEDPAQAVSVGDRVRVKVLGVDVGKRRLSLSVKALLPAPPPMERSADGPGGRRGRGGRGGGPGGRGRGGRDGGGGGARRGSASTRHEIPREKDPFHLQLNALREQLGFQEPEAPKPAKKPKARRAAREAKNKQSAAEAAVAGSEPAELETSDAAPAVPQPAEAAPVAVNVEAVAPSEAVAEPTVAPQPAAEPAAEPVAETTPEPEAPEPVTPEAEAVQAAPTETAPTEAGTPEPETPETVTPETVTPATTGGTEPSDEEDRQKA